MGWNRNLQIIINEINVYNRWLLLEIIAFCNQNIIQIHRDY